MTDKARTLSLMALKQKAQIAETLTEVGKLARQKAEAEAMTRRLAVEEGIFAGISSGGGVAVALRLAQQLENAVIVSIICDPGDR